MFLGHPVVVIASQWNRFASPGASFSDSCQNSGAHRRATCALEVRSHITIHFAGDSHRWYHDDVERVNQLRQGPEGSIRADWTPRRSIPGRVCANWWRCTGQHILPSGSMRHRDAVTNKRHRSATLIAAMDLRENSLPQRRTTSDNTSSTKLGSVTRRSRDPWV